MAQVGEKIGLGARSGFGGDTGRHQLAIGLDQFIVQPFGAEGGANAGAQFSCSKDLVM